MQRIALFALLLGLSLTAFAQDRDDDRVIVIKMVDLSTAQWRFEPAEITVRQGDTIRWVQEDIVPHNVEFKETPESASLGDAVMGPFVFAKGEVYELVIDERFAPGLYVYVCTPHDALGMKAEFSVVPSTGQATN